jgi:hypothetical protein
VYKRQQLCHLLQNIQATVTDIQKLVINNSLVFNYFELKTSDVATFINHFWKAHPDKIPAFLQALDYAEALEQTNEAAKLLDAQRS